MRIRGKWVAGADNKDRPFVRVRMPVHGGGPPFEDDFLVNTGADLTVMKRSVLDALGRASLYVPTPGVQSASAARGIVAVYLRIELISPTDPPYAVPGHVYAALDPAALTENVLGLDVLRLFHVIVSRQHDEVLLLDGSHAYQPTGRP